MGWTAGQVRADDAHLNNCEQRLSTPPVHSCGQPVHRAKAAEYQGIGNPGRSVAGLKVGNGDAGNQNRQRNRGCGVYQRQRLAADVPDEHREDPEKQHTYRHQKQDRGDQERLVDVLLAEQAA